MMQINSIINSRYKIVSLIGTGGMSYVYKAYDEQTKKYVAIKILKEENSDDEEFVKKFKREAESTCNLHHKNIIQTYYVLDDKNLHFIVMELIEGKNLKHYIQEKGKLTNEETVNFALQIARGLEYAHKNGIIHRDIKPQNIVINKKHIAKISDFGIAKVVSQATTTSNAVGSIHYMSPEQAKSNNVDERSDLYSLGCTMYEMITGKVPFDGDSVSSIVLAHLKDNIKLPSIDNSSIYLSLEKIILKLTEKDLSKRYQTATELIHDLKKATKIRDGSYIYYDDVKILDETIVLNEDDKKVVRNWTENIPTNNNYSPKIMKTYNSQRIKLIIASIIGIICIIVIIVLSYNLIILRKHNENMRTNIINTNSDVGKVIIATITNSYDSKLVVDFKGININTAMQIARPYNIQFNVIEEKFSNEEKGTILQINGKEFEKNAIVDVVVSKGLQVLDFTKMNLNAYTKEQLVEELDDRGLDYNFVEEYNDTVIKNNIITTNKKLSSDEGDLIIYVSLGKDTNINEPIIYNVEDEDNSWYTKINRIYILGVENEPNINTNNAIIVQIRLRQIVGNEIIYTELTEPKEYKAGTKIPIVFSKIVGEKGVGNGQIQIVDVENDIVLQSYDLKFSQNENQVNEAEMSKRIITPRANINIIKED